MSNNFIFTTNKQSCNIFIPLIVDKTLLIRGNSSRTYLGEETSRFKHVHLETKLTRSESEDQQGGTGCQSPLEWLDQTYWQRGQTPLRGRRGRKKGGNAIKANHSQWKPRYIHRKEELTTSGIFYRRLVLDSICKYHSLLVLQKMASMIFLYLYLDSRSLSASLLYSVLYWEAPVPSAGLS